MVSIPSPSVASDAAQAGARLRALLGVEARAARLEGLLIADPELGRLWRAQAALLEAVRSVWLEDIALRETDLVLERFARRRAGDAERLRGAAHAAAMLRLLTAPPDLLGAPEVAVARCLAAAVVEGPAARDDLPPAGALGPRVAAAARDAASPYLGALAAAVALRAATGGTAPAAERLVFMLADHALRGAGDGRQGRAHDDDAPPDQALAPRGAGWVLTPSLALTRDGFRAWAPGSGPGVAALTEGLAGAVDEALGRLALLRRWRDRARAAAVERRGGARLDDLVGHVIAHPLVTSRSVTGTLGVSPRAGLDLVTRAERAGILTCLTPRRSYRAWAVAPLADLLGAAPRHRPGDRDGGGAGEGDESTPPDLAADLDAALAEIDRLLTRPAKG